MRATCPRTASSSSECTCLRRLFFCTVDSDLEDATGVVDALETVRLWLLIDVIRSERVGVREVRENTGCQLQAVSGRDTKYIFYSTFYSTHFSIFGSSFSSNVKPPRPYDALPSVRLRDLRKCFGTKTPKICDAKRFPDPG